MSEMLQATLAIGIGAWLGALLRWGLGLSLNALFPAVPPGTLAANYLGSYLVGIAVVVFAQHPGLAPEWRLFVITGFLGGLTTFSTFSAEVSHLLQQGRYGLASLAVAAHLCGCLLLTLAGIATMSLLRKG